MRRLRGTLLLFAVVVMISVTWLVLGSCSYIELRLEKGRTIDVTRYSFRTSMVDEFDVGREGVLRIGDGVVADDVYSAFSLLSNEGIRNVWLALPSGGKIRILYGDIGCYYRDRCSDVQISCEIESHQEKISYRFGDGNVAHELTQDSNWDVEIAKAGPLHDMEICSTGDFPFGIIVKLCQSAARCGCRRMYFGVVVK